MPPNTPYSSSDIKVKARIPSFSSRRPLKKPPTIMPKPDTEVISCAVRSPPSRTASSGRIGGIAARVSPTAALGAAITT